MKLNLDSNNLTIGFNKLYINQDIYEKNNKLSIVKRVEDNIQIKNDIVEISEQGQLKLKIRNLEEASRLEKRRDEINGNINEKLEALEDAHLSIKDAIELVKQSIHGSLSIEDKEEIQTKIEEIIEEIKDIANEAIKNNPKVKVDKDDITGINANELKELEKENSLKEIEENETDQDGNKVDLSTINILKDPSNALGTLMNASEAVMQEIAKLMEMLSNLEKSIQELLGEYDERKEIKNLYDLDDMEKSENNKIEKDLENSKEDI